ncbi:hypothetical protein Fcan01_10999 [Folsomia candida]|uniref:Ig-like domain-containing protein n=1 Tax=Folsomia candida TaxID=158441 RepID=A0A226ECG2_FOLCA|nr:hypothetical protein Fcan01_10999 [Folsomia candida]
MGILLGGKTSCDSGEDIAGTARSGDGTFLPSKQPFENSPTSEIVLMAAASAVSHPLIIFTSDPSSTIIKKNKDNSAQKGGSYHSGNNSIKLSCKIVTFDMTLNQTNSYEEISNIFSAMEILGENPSYILLWTQEEPQESHNFVKFLQNFKNIWVTSTILVVKAKSRSVSMLCYTCVRIFHQISKLSRYDKELTKLWETLHLNWNKKLVLQISLYVVQHDSIYNCYRPFKLSQFPVSAELCVSQTLSKKYNYTAAKMPDYRKVETLGIVWYTGYQKMMLSGPINKPPFASGSQGYYVQMFAQPVKIGFTAFQGSLDETIWIFWVVSGLLICIVLWTSSFLFRDKLGLLELLFWLVASFFEQSLALRGSKRTNYCTRYPSQSVPWMLGLIILINLYKGDMTSHLTSVVFPEVPPNLNGLVESGQISLVTTSIYPSYRGERDGNSIYYIISEMKYAVAKIIMASMNYRNLPTNRVRILTHLIEKTSLVYIPNFTNGIITWVQKFSQRQKFTVNTKEWESLPDISALSVFGIVDSDQILNPLTKLMQLFSSHVPKVKFPVVVEAYSWFMYRNAFARVYSRGLGQLEQSGIWKFWLDRRTEIDQMEYVTQYDASLSEGKIVQLVMSKYWQNRKNLGWG